MNITLKIVKSPAGVPLSEATKSFGGEGGLIGRAASNDWALADPEKYMSSKHCELVSDNGQFFLVDTSTNGTFVNGSAEPLGRGNRIALSHGDRFEIGDYSFEVELSSAFASTGHDDPFAAPPFTPEVNAGESPSDIFGGAVGNNGSDEGWGQATSGMSPPKPEQPDALGDFSSSFGSGAPSATRQDAAGLDPFGASPMPDDPFFSSGTQPDDADPMHMSVEWPEARQDESLIPEDWFGGAQDAAQSPMEGGAPPDYQSPPVHTPPPHNLDQGVPPVTPQPFDAGNRPSQPVNQPPSPGYTQAPGQPSTVPPEQPDPRAHPPTMPPGAQPVSQPGYGQAPPVAHPSQHEPYDAQGQMPSQGYGTQAPAPHTPTPHTQVPGSAGPVVGPSRALLSAMGLEVSTLNQQKQDEVEAVVGEVVRETIGGLMQILRSRTSIKNEFRMNVTTIQPIENNPIKFSASVDEVLDIMFVRDTQAYKEPVDAVRESFQSIADHQVAILAGIRSAFKAVMDRFDPAELEAKFERQGRSGGALLPGMQKAKYWNAYENHYKDMVENMENSFQDLFGEEFVQAYEEQLRKISIARKVDS